MGFGAQPPPDAEDLASVAPDPGKIVPDALFLVSPSFGM